MTRGVWGPSFQRKKLVIGGGFLAFFPLFIDAVWATGGLLLATLSLGCYLLLSTMLGTAFRVYNMHLNMEINKK
jgi:hypothetical protein